jgi:hypothetical protein
MKKKQLTNVSLGSEERGLPRWGRRSRRGSEDSLRQEALQRLVYLQGARAVPVGWLCCKAALLGELLTVVDPRAAARRRVTCIASMDS